MGEEQDKEQESGTESVRPQASTKIPDASEDDVQKSEPDKASLPTEGHEKADGHDWGFLEPRTNVVVLEPSDSDKPNVDVVAVHGIWGQGKKCWETNSDPSVVWLHDAFGKEKHPRVIVLEYQTTYLTFQGVYEIARRLLLSLLELRDQINTTRRPIIFACHDVGGLIVKSCLVLAASNKSKYADILQSVRVLTFFGYPHRNPIKTDLEEHYGRLIRLQPEPKDQEYSSRLSRTLAKMTIEINEKFLHTGMLMQTIQLNVFSTKADSSDYVFDKFTATLGIDGEFRVGVDATHQFITRASSSTESPFKARVDDDWFEGNHNSGRIDVLGCVRDQAPPVYLPGNDKVLVEYTEDLKNLLKANSSTGNHFHHIRCKEGTVDSVSERCRNLMDAEKGFYQLFHYFRFRSDDVRCNSLRPLLCAMLAHTSYNRLASLNWQHAVSGIGPGYNWYPMDLVACWEAIRCAPVIQDAVYMFAGLDECEEDEALWLLREFEEKRQRVEQPLKIVFLTTAGSPQDGRIFEALSKMPADAVTTIDYSDEKLGAIETDRWLYALLQDDPRFADRSIAQGIAGVITRCEDDNDLVHLLIAALRLSSNHERLVESLTSDTQTPVSGRIFELVLSEIAREHQPWAKLIMSWVSAAVRPLRVHEFHLLSEMCAHHSGSDAGQQVKFQDHPKVRYEVGRAIEKFHGLLRVENDEIHFSHRRIRPWLVSQSVGHNHSDTPNPWYCKKTGESDHRDILEMCLTYLGRLAEPDESNASFSYIIEHWTHHYKLVEGANAERVLEQVLSDTTVLHCWITLYKALPTPPVKPSAGTSEALAISAYFGLGDCIKLLTATNTYPSDAWDRAILEAVKAAELSIVQLLFQSMPHTFKFNDEGLHEIVRKSMERGHPKIAMEVIRRIPAASEPVPNWKLQAKTDTVVSIVDPKNTSDDSTPQDEGRGGATTTAKPENSSEPKLGKDEKVMEQNQPNSFEWLGLPLSQAAKLGLSEAVTILLALGADINSTPRRGESTRSALSVSCARGHEEVVRILLDNGADMELSTGLQTNLSSPLYLACSWGNLGVVRLLLGRGASLTTRHTDGWLPLHAAAKWGAYSCAEALLAHRRYDEYLSADDPAPLPLAVRSCRYKTAEALLRHGLDPNSHDNDGTALWHAVENGRVDLCRLLLNYKADPNAHTDNSAPPLVLAMKRGNMEIIKMLVEKGAEIEKPGTIGPFHGTPLLMSVVWAGPGNSENIEVLRYLLEKKADPNVQDKGGWSLLWLAVWWGKAENARILCEAGADVNAISTARTPLHASIDSSEAQLDVVRVLLDHGADVNKFVEGSGTPLSSAINGGKPATIKLMLNHEKAKPDLTQSSFKKAVLDATRSNRPDLNEILLLLLEAGADVDMREYSDQTPLMCAMMASPEVVRTILQYRPNLQARDADNDTVLTWIATGTTVDVVKLIMRCGGELEVQNKLQYSPLMKAVEVQNIEVSKFLLTKDSVRANINTPGVSGPPLHIACANDDLDAANLLIEHEANIEYIMEGSSLISGTALMRAIINRGEKCAKMLIERGANVRHPAGHFRYPIITASLAGMDVEFIRLLLRQPGVTVDVADDLNRKPAHLACLNGLALFNALQVPDEDLAARDDYGRYPLHFACLSGDAALVSEVLERSGRAGVDINARDDDGWTPLMVAARTCDTWAHDDYDATNHIDIIRLLLDRGADPALDAEGFKVESAAENGKLAAADIARYHQADAAVVTLLDEGLPAGRKKLREFGEAAEKLYCDSCFARCYGVFFRCADCRPRVDLCFKCARHRVKIHPVHDMVQTGTTSTVETPVGEAASEEKTSASENEAPAGNDGASYNFDEDIQDLAAAMNMVSSGLGPGDEE